MAISRITRVTEKRERQRLQYSIIGIVALVVFIALFGIKVLVGFSLALDRIRGGSPTSSQRPSIIIPPVLDSLPLSTNQEAVTLTGSGQSGFTLVVYLNDAEIKKLTIEDSGTFTIPMTLLKGVNTISSKIVDDSGVVSELSNILTITLKTDEPMLEIYEPADGQTTEGENNTVSLVGKTDEGNTLTVNGRFVIVGSDGTFRFTITASEGENIFTIVALDPAGNQTVVERKITYRP